MMMGAPGSGKGTQAKLLADTIGAKVYSSGSRLREMAASGTYFGKRAQAVMSAGDLMPVWVSQYLFEEALLKLSKMSKKEIGVLIRELVESGLAIIATSAQQAAKKSMINTDDYSKLNRADRRKLERK